MPLPYSIASMGPRSVERGKYAASACRRVPNAASMGPRSVERGKFLTQRDDLRHRPASMGPRSVERGKTLKIVSEVPFPKLQWGRVLLNAESPAADFRRRRGRGASMGPRSVERGKGLCSRFAQP